MTLEEVNPGDFQSSYARDLLSGLDFAVKDHVVDLAPVNPHSSWEGSGLMWLTGFSDLPPVFCPVPVAACAQGVWLALESICKSPAIKNFDASRLLAERAAFMSLTRQGDINLGGSCRFLQAADAEFVINMTRDSDWEMLPALFEGQIDNAAAYAHDWLALKKTAKFFAVSDLLERARLLGLALVPAEGLSLPHKSWVESTLLGRRADTSSRLPLVLDLSSLWAGPLCSHLLHKIGARVIKVESLSRPDGARSGNKKFYDLLNAGKQSVALDFKTEEGIAQLKLLIKSADIVIEGSRPRALHQMGIYAEQIVAERPGLTWLSITGYGRASPYGDWVAFGDDAAVAAGLSAAIKQDSGDWLFCGDAIADPLTGLHAALAAWASWKRGGGHMLDVSLYHVVSHCMKSAAAQPRTKLHYDSSTDCFDLARQKIEVKKPQLRRVIGAAAELGRDNQVVMNEFVMTC
jgi:hypothetical protein